jgi:aryl-alcohol dehydrogenase-like predicted oxidoreductase
MQSLDASLKRMKLDYIDLYWMHNWDFSTPVDEVMRALDDAVRDGKILYAGLSDAPAWVAARCNTVAELRGWTQFSSMQLEYSLVERGIEREHFPMCRDMDINITAWSPLASGMLSGKYTRGSDDARRLDTLPFHDITDKRLEIAGVVDQVADEAGCSSAQAALAWVRQRGTIPIIGARTLAQLQDNLGSLEVTLSDEQMQTLNDASSFAFGHPYDFLEKEMVYAIATGGMGHLIDNHHDPR